MSITPWFRRAPLSDCPRSAVLRVLHYAVPRTISCTLCDVEATQAWPVPILYSVPATRDRIFHVLRVWLRKHAMCSSPVYASWHVLHSGPYTPACPIWCYNFPPLLANSPRTDSPGSIPVGLTPRGEGISGFPAISLHM